MLARYNDVVADGAERLFSLVEGQSAHRQKCEWKLVRSRTFNETAGTLLGFVAFFAVLAASMWLILHGYEKTGVGLMAAQLGGGIFVRVHGHKAIVDAIRKAQRDAR